MQRYPYVQQPIAFALDVNAIADAQRFCDLLDEHVGAFKVGLELFVSARALPETTRPIILDLKLHDIPATVERAVKAVGDLGARYATLHVQQRAALEAAVKAAEPFGMQLLGVTLLTSMDGADAIDLGLAPSMGDRWAPTRVRNLARFASGCGLTGFVCSPKEVAMLRASHPESFLLVPGVRPSGVDADDQKRVATPEQAVLDGASMVVVGRPIRDAADPTAAARAIAQRITTAQRSSE